MTSRPSSRPPTRALPFEIDNARALDLVDARLDRLHGVPGLGEDRGVELAAKDVQRGFRFCHRDKR